MYTSFNNTFPLFYICILQIKQDFPFIYVYVYTIIVNGLHSALSVWKPVPNYALNVLIIYLGGWTEDGFRFHWRNIIINEYWITMLLDLLIASIFSGWQWKKYENTFWNVFLISMFFDFKWQHNDLALREKCECLFGNNFYQISVFLSILNFNSYALSHFHNQNMVICNSNTIPSVLLE